MKNWDNALSQIMIREQKALCALDEVEQEIDQIKSKKFWRWNSSLFQAEKEDRISQLKGDRSRLLRYLDPIQKERIFLQMVVNISNLIGS